MKTKVRIVIMWHLSDAEKLIGFDYLGVKKEIRHQIEFAKWLLLKYPDTSVEIDADIEHDSFIQMKNELNKTVQ